MSQSGQLIILVIAIVLAVIIFVVLTVILSVIHVKKQRLENRNKLPQAKKLNFPYDDLLKYAGGIENIASINANINKVKITFYDQEKINTQEIKKMKHVSGTFMSSTKIDLIVGKEAKLLADKINMMIMKKSYQPKAQVAKVENKIQ